MAAVLAAVDLVDGPGAPAVLPLVADGSFYAVQMLRRMDRAGAERAAAAYADLLAGFGAFTLYRSEAR